MKVLGMAGGIYRACEWVMRFASLNLIWVIVNLPIALLIINLLNANQLSQVIFSYAAIGVLIPFLIFPSTTAVFGVVRKWVMKEGDIKVWHSFFNFYKENYLKSMSGGLVITLMWFIVTFYLYSLYLHLGLGLLPVYILIYVVLSVFTLHFFSLTVHFDIKLLSTFKNSFLITIGRPINTLGMALVSCLIVFLSVKIVSFFLPFFIVSLIAYPSFLGFYSHLRRVNNLREVNP
ncbi:DUF624 domain-containing protein [Pullulanibacillus sp. KACC 23026]|uniref:YesL family protein n=1 Tax=Pullulanibacillus sp. KACC 23026 TaxID=3028315 RepID=UPI0023B13A00|nr:DUF624 domain-containing protein [Pullulanibacillus sp. KACC 23026]WEG11733.1 DUF624 domain-containing protein [Pullulanibacillus sp. KACC 23026]